MEKVIREGKVAVIYSTEFGAGWYSWNRGIPECVFHPALVMLVDANEIEKAGVLAKEMWPDGHWSPGQLEIMWLPVGTRFLIDEYGGNESIQVLSPETGLVA